MERKNRIKTIVNRKFKLEPDRPTLDLLRELGITINRYNQIINNKGSKEMNAEEIHRFSIWLQLPIQELFEETRSYNKLFDHA